MDIRLSGTIMDNESADIMRYFGFNDVICPGDIRNALSEAEDAEDVTLYINSGGGVLQAGHEIYCYLKSHKGEITAHVQSLAASAATIPMMACSKRIAEPVSVLCIHNPRSFAHGDHIEFRKAAVDLDTLKDSILNAYERVLNKTREEIAALMDEDKLLDANQALELGLIDEIAGDAAAPTSNLYVAAAGHYIFPTPEMRKQYAQRAENDKKALEAQELRLKILSK